jgi:hypothetical protein
MSLDGKSSRSLSLNLIFLSKLTERLTLHVVSSTSTDIHIHTHFYRSFYRFIIDAAYPFHFRVYKVSARSAAGHLPSL